MSYLRVNQYLQILHSVQHLKNYKNLNEQISRIKSLFGDDRIHGNLINEKIEISKPLVTEQKWKKQLLNAIKGVDVDSSVYKILERRY